MKLVDGIGADQLVVAQRQQLRTPDKQRIEAGDARPANRAWIRIIEVIVVDEVIGRDLAQPAVPVDADRTLIVSNSLRKRRGGILACADVGRWNVLQQILTRRRPRALRNDSAGKDAGVGLSRCDSVAQTLREQ